MQPCNLENEIRSTGSFLGRIVPKTSYEIRLWNNIGGGIIVHAFPLRIGKEGNPILYARRTRTRPLRGEYNNRFPERFHLESSSSRGGKVRDGSLRREQMKFDSPCSIWLIKLERVGERKGLSIRTKRVQHLTLPKDAVSVVSVDHRVTRIEFFQRKEEARSGRENSFSPVLSSS